MHAFTLDHQFPNGNDSGMGVVLRDHRDSIFKMYSETIRNLTPRGLKLWSQLVGLRGSYF